MLKGIVGICAVFLLFAFLLIPVVSDSKAAGGNVAGPALDEDPPEHAQGGQREDFTIKVDAPLVTAGVTVIGKTVPELKTEDFIVRDNGIPQEIALFSRDQSPLAIALVIDRSRSIVPYVPMLQIAAISALRQLKPEDQVVLFSFDVQRHRLTELTHDRLHTAEKISKFKVAEVIGTVIYDAICDAAIYLGKKAPNSRRAIILISDNCHTGGGGYSPDGARSKALENAVTVYSIKTPGYGSEYPDFIETNSRIRQIAEDTGGAQLRVGASQSLQDAFENALSYLRMQYAIGFAPSDPGEKGSHHKLSISLASEDRCIGCRLLSRSGYYFGVSPQPPPQSGGAKIAARIPEKTDELLIQRIILAAGTVDSDLYDIPFTVRTAEQKNSSGDPELKVDLVIHFSRIAFRAVESRRSCKLRVAVFYTSSSGKILGSDSRKIEGLLSEDTFSRVLSSGISYSATIPLKEPKQMLKIVVFDEQSDRVGSKLIRLP